MIRSSLVAAAALVLLSAGPASAATVSGKSLAKKVDTIMTKAVDLEVTKATCPKRVTVRKGRSATCKLTFETRDRSDARVRFTSSTGRFRVTLTHLLMRNLESQIERDAAEQDVTAEVDCPERRRVDKGDTFTCTGTDPQGATLIFDLTQKGGGLVDYKLRASDAVPAAS